MPWKQGVPLKVYVCTLWPVLGIKKLQSDFQITWVPQGREGRGGKGGQHGDRGAREGKEDSEDNLEERRKEGGGDTMREREAKRGEIGCLECTYGCCSD